MEEGLQRTRGRRFWEDVPATIAATPPLLSPPVLQQRQQRQREEQQRTDGSRYRRPDQAARAPAAISRVEVSAAPGVDRVGIDGEAKQGSSELKKLAFTLEDGMI